MERVEVIYVLSCRDTLLLEIEFNGLRIGKLREVAMHEGD